MANPTPEPTLQTDAADATPTVITPGPLNCLIGALIAGGFAVALYSLTRSIAQTFASKPIPSGNAMTASIAVAVRTLVVGVSALGTGVFGLAALGLTALAVQVLIQRLKNRHRA